MRAWALGAAVALVFARGAYAADACPIPGGTGSVDVFLDAALAAKGRGESDIALSCLGRAYLLEPSAGLLHNMGRLFEDLGRYRQAAESYRRLIADPAADQALKDADQTRLHNLEVRLDRAWIMADFAGGLRVLFGKRYLVSGQELDARPGSVVLEIVDGDTLHVLRFTALVGQRTDVKLPVPPSAERDAWIDLGIGPRAVAVDGREVDGPFEAIARLRLESGAHDLEWTDRQGHSQRVAIALAPGQTWVLGAGGPVGASPWPWIAGGTTLALGATSAVFFGLAEGDRATIRNAARDGNGVVTGITFAEAAVLDERSADRTVLAAVLIGGAITSLGLTLLAAWMTEP